MSALRIMHLTDSHVSIESEGGGVDPYRDNRQRMHDAFRSRDPPPIEQLSAALGRAARNDVDLIVHTGDLVNFPDVKSIEAVHELLRRSRLPWIYVAGNHDWHYEGLPGTSDALRLEWRRRLTLF